MTSLRRNVRQTVAALIGVPMSVLIGLAFASTVQAASTNTNLANHLVISQVQVRTSNNEFIELYNPSSTAVSLTNYSLQYKAAADPFPVTTVITFPGTATVQPHQYYLVRSGATTNTDADLNAAQLGALPATDGDIFLANTQSAVTANNDTTIIDKLGYGSADAAEGTAAPYPTSTQSLVRKPGLSYGAGNGVDTDNNANDFSISETPSPRNSSVSAQSSETPTISSPTPGDGSSTNDKNVTIQATVTDAAGINTSGFTFNLDSTTISSGYNYNASTGSFSYTTNNLSDGTHTVSLTATNAFGVTTTQNWTFTVDTVKPVAGITISDSTPHTSKLATTVQLTATDQGSGVDQMQIAFDGFFDNEPWEPFTSTVTRNLMNKEGLQAIIFRVKDKAGNISDTVEATTTLELTPISAPTNAISSTVGNTITITWNPVANAVSYLVRYNDGQTLYGPLSTQSPFIVISNLDMSKKYAFEVAAVSRFGTVSLFTKVYPPELLPTSSSTNTVSSATTSQTTTPEATTHYTSSVTQTTPTPSTTVSPTPSPSASPSGEIKSDNSSKQPDWTKAIIALSILIIAAGVATGGWYLYQWWTTDSDDSKDKKGKGRW